MIILLLLIMIILLVFYVIKLVDVASSGLAPYISTPDSALPQILRALDIQDSDTVWDLGCGDARVLSYCAKAHTKASFIGIETGILPFLQAKWKTRSQKNIQIMFASLRRINPASATKMYLYLLPQALNIIKPVIPQNCQVVSAEFKFSNTKPIKVIPLKHPQKLAHKLYLYKF